MNPQMNPPSSGNSLNSSRKSDFSSIYKQSFPSHIKITSKETFKPKSRSKRSPDTCSIESNSQHANTPREQISLENIIPPQQNLATEISLAGYYRCGHAKPIECPCCAAITEKSERFSPKKGPEKVKKKAEELAKAVFTTIESRGEVIEKVTDVTEDTRSAIEQFFKAKQRELQEMMERLLGDLDDRKKNFLDNVKFDQLIEIAEKDIGILEGDWEDIGQLKAAFDESDNVKNAVLEKNQMIQELGDSLLKRADTKAFKENLGRVVKIDHKAFEALQFPEFIDPEKYQTVSQLGSTMTPMSSFYLSVVSSKPSNFEGN